MDEIPACDGTQFDVLEKNWRRVASTHTLQASGGTRECATAPRPLGHVALTALGPAGVIERGPAG